MEVRVINFIIVLIWCDDIACTYHVGMLWRGNIITLHVCGDVYDVGILKDLIRICSQKKNPSALPAMELYWKFEISVKFWALKKIGDSLRPALGRKTFLAKCFNKTWR